VPPESQQNQQKKKIGRPRKFDEAFQQSVVERMKTCNDVSALVRELQVSRSQVYRWRDEALGRVAVPSPRTAAQIQEKREEQQQRRIAELERLVARQALDLDFFKGALLRIEENRRKRTQTSGMPSTNKSGK
jgi:transposase-like protein